MAKRKQKWIVGDIFTLPLLDETYSVGQVVYLAEDALNSVICAFFCIRLHSRDIQDADIPALESDKLVSLQFATIDCLKSNRWCVRANRLPFDIKEYISIDELQRNGFVGVKVRGCGNLNDLMNAFYKLKPWDDFYDPTYLDTLLISPDRKPNDVLLKSVSKLASE